MNKQLTQAEISECMSPVEILPPMSRYQKLKRLAAVIRKEPGPIYIFHQIEYMPMHRLAGCIHPCSAFSLALKDPELIKAGLKPDLQGNVSVANAQQFFELGKHELHEFSCDCGGGISNKEMANRIEHIAGPGPVTASPKPSVFGRVFDSKAWTG